MKKYIWIILGVLTLGVDMIFGHFQSLYEHVYLRSIFQVLRIVYDYTLGWVPFPMVYILFAVVVHIIYRFIQFKDFRAAKSVGGKISAIFLPIASLLGAVIFFFYFLWGFHYRQQPMSDYLALPEVDADSLELYEKAVFIMNKMDDLRAEITSDTAVLSFDDLPDQYEGEIRIQLEELLSTWDIPVKGRVRVRSLYPKGILLRISTAGVYIPFVFEGHIDAGLHPIQYPYTMAHEMSHGYGLADEGTCNFTGFLACMKSDNPFIQYSACMSFWRYMANNLRRGAPSLYRQLTREIPTLVKKDLIAVMDEMDKYPDILPEVRDAVYDTYLKSHGVAGGLSSYSKVVELVFSWQKSERDKMLTDKIFEH